MQERIYFETYEISSVEEAINLIAIYGKYNNIDNSYVFRGHKDINYQLLPTSKRMENKEHLWLLSGIKPLDEQSELECLQIIVEYNVLKNFYNLSDGSGLNVPHVDKLRINIDVNIESSLNLKTDEWISDDLMEIAGLAQHYGLPTRLLDWTYDYKIALYFATSGIYDSNEYNKDCVVWAINYQYFNSLKQTDKNIPLNFYRPSYFGNRLV